VSKAIFYIDGYNWYHAVFRHYPEWKWLNIQGFCESLRPHDEVTSVKVFSALIDPENPSSDARERQVRYFNALRTLPKIKIILGAFQPREVTCRAHCGQKYLVPEEKKTDVNIAVEMISDALEGNCDAIYIISGDSDVQPAVEWIRKRFQAIKIAVYVPSLPSEQPTRRLDYYRTRGLDVECKFLPLGGIKDHQLPNTVKLPNGHLAVRPHVWARISG
jgi:uncharacterized LabA/DUF88 family protein